MGTRAEPALSPSSSTATNPDDLNAWLLRLILAKSAAEKDPLAQTIRQATIRADQSNGLDSQGCGG